MNQGAPSIFDCNVHDFELNKEMSDIKMPLYRSSTPQKDSLWRLRRRL